MMRRFFLILAATCLTLTMSAQKKHERFDPHRFDVSLEQFVTTEACLSPVEAEVFFPLYQEYMDKQRALRKDERIHCGYKPATDKECREAIEYSDNIDIETKELQKEYHRKFMKVLPASKVYDILKAIDKFHRECFKEAKGERKR